MKSIRLITLIRECSLMIFIEIFFRYERFVRRIKIGPILSDNDKELAAKSDKVVILYMETYKIFEQLKENNFFFTKSLTHEKTRAFSRFFP